MIGSGMIRALVVLLILGIAQPAWTADDSAPDGTAVKSGKTRSPAGPEDYTQAGPHAVSSTRVEWKDARRDREVPAKIYFPADGEGPFPMVIFSHGLGGSREGYAYLGRHWASHGYVSVHLEHDGSDAEVWRGQADAAAEMNRAAKDPRNAIDRPKDVSLAIDELTRMNGEKDGPLENLLDVERIAVAGHSFGAFTALAVVGEAGSHAVDGRALADARVKAAIPMSAPVPAARQLRFDAVYGRIATPCLHMTGTLDESPIAFTKAEDRRVPYDHIKLADQYLVTFIGGDHAIFSGRIRRGRQAERDEVFAALIRMSTTAFLDAYLNEDAKAKQWLQTGGLKAALGAHARLEQKRAGSQPAEAGPAPRVRSWAAPASGSRARGR